MRALLEWLGFPTRESTSRDLTAWLLSIDGDRVATTLVGFDVGPIAPKSIKTECALEGAANARMRLDLYVESEKVVVGIEMKVHSSAGAGQLDAYARWLKGRAGHRRAVLVFLTEIGAVPEYPDEFRARIAPVELVCATWDRLAELIPLDDPLGWKAAATERASEIGRHEELVCGASPVPSVPKTHSRIGNVRARGVLALATRVASETGLRHVMGPTFGDYHLDPQVDLAKPAWTVDLGFEDELFRKANPLSDARLRFAVRARFRENERGDLILGIGSAFIPYPPAIGSKSKRGPVMAAASPAMTRGLALRQLLVDRLHGSCGMSTSDWHMSHILLDTWAGNRVALASQALKQRIPIIDEAIAQWIKTERLPV